MVGINYTLCMPTFDEPAAEPTAQLDGSPADASGDDFINIPMVGPVSKQELEDAISPFADIFATRVAASLAAQMREAQSSSAAPDPTPAPEPAPEPELDAPPTDQPAT